MGVRANARIASVALLAAMLAVGFLAGVAWQRDAPAENPPDQGERDGRPGRDGRRLVIDQVGLAPETRAQVLDVVRHFRSRMHALDRELRADYEPRQRALVRETRDSIKSLLSPQQRAVYDSLLATRHRRRGGEDHRAGPQNRRGER